MTQLTACPTSSWALLIDQPILSFFDKTVNSFVNDGPTQRSMAFSSKASSRHYRRCQTLSTTRPRGSTVIVTTTKPCTAGMPREGGYRHTYRLRPDDPVNCSRGGPNRSSAHAISTPSSDASNAAMRSASRCSRQRLSRSESTDHEQKPPRNRKKTVASSTSIPTLAYSMDSHAPKLAVCGSAISTISSKQRAPRMPLALSVPRAEEAPAVGKSEWILPAPSPNRA